MFKAADLFDLTQTEHAAIFDGCNYASQHVIEIMRRAGYGLFERISSP